MKHDYCFNLGLLFSDIAKAFPLRVALKYPGGQTETYAGLDTVSNRIAHFLRNQGARRGEVVAILNDKSVMAYALMVACLKLGLPYTNLDIGSPLERLKKMLHYASPRWLFTNSACLEKAIPCFTPERLIDYSKPDFFASVETFPKNLPVESALVNGNIPAYLMFTSGSTGFPKGVVITHANVLNFIHWAVSTFGITHEDTLTNINPMHFDNSVFDFYASLFTGATMIPVAESLLKIPRQLIDALNTLHPTIWFSVPSMLVYILRCKALKATDLSTLKIVSFGGEGFPKGQLRNLWSLLGDRVRFINVYGPTECTCICSSYDVSAADLESDELLPLGPVSPNFDFLVLDEDHKPVNGGEVGELCLIGPNVGKGYYNNPEKTSEVFIQHPCITAHREIVYRSGDLVCYDQAKNVLLFRGRIDNQIKRMGYRIELEEIENALSSLPNIEENAVIYHQANSDTGRIIACICPASIDESAMLAELRRLLPAYMIPNVVKLFDKLPKNQNGKIDRLALKEIVGK